MYLNWECSIVYLEIGTPVLIKKHVLHLESNILTCASISYLAVAAEEADDKVLLVPSFGSSCHVIFVCY